MRGSTWDKPICTYPSSILTCQYNITHSTHALKRRKYQAILPPSLPTCLSLSLSVKQCIIDVCPLHCSGVLVRTPPVAPLTTHILPFVPQPTMSPPLSHKFNSAATEGQLVFLLADSVKNWCRCKYKVPSHSPAPTESNISAYPLGTKQTKPNQTHIQRPCADPAIRAGRTGAGMSVNLNLNRLVDRRYLKDGFALG